jgi:hypothetical protein
VTLLDYGGAVTWRRLVLDSEGQPGINLRPRGKNVLNWKGKLLDFRLVETFFENIKAFRSYDQFNTTT